MCTISSTSDVTVSEGFQITRVEISGEERRALREQLDACSRIHTGAMRCSTSISSTSGIDVPEYVRPFADSPILAPELRDVMEQFVDAVLEQKVLMSTVYYGAREKHKTDGAVVVLFPYQNLGQTRATETSRIRFIPRENMLNFGCERALQMLNICSDEFGFPVVARLLIKQSVGLNAITLGG